MIALSEGRTRFESELPVYTMTGERKIVDLHVSVAPDYENTLSRVLVSFIDLTEHKQAEELRRYKELFEKVDDGVFIINSENKIVETNDGFADKTGFTRNELLSLSIDDLVVPEHVSLFTNLEKRIFREGVTQFEVSMHSKNGNIIPFFYSCHGISFKGEHCFLCVARDMTRIKELQNQLILSERLAATGQFAATIVHEIKNPLTVIGGFARSILKKYEDKERTLRNANFITEEIGRLEHLITQLLDLSKPVVLNTSKTDLRELITNTLRLLADSFISSHVSVSTHFPEGKIEYDLDTEKMEEVFINLFQNAIHAMPDGGSIEISTAKTEDKLVISIKDTGVGISAEHLEKIFNPFFTTRSKGTGLGLSISQKIVQSHEGTISVQSAERRGSTFIIQLPLQ